MKATIILKQESPNCIIARVTGLAGGIFNADMFVVIFDEIPAFEREHSCSFCFPVLNVIPPLLVFRKKDAP